MPNGFPAFPQSQSPNHKPPTLFHSASPKMQPTTSTSNATASEVSDTASVASASTFSSSVGLLKNKFSLHKGKTTSEKEKPKKVKLRSPEEWNARARTAEAYFVQATLR